MIEDIVTIVKGDEIGTEIEVELKPNLPLYTNASSIVKSLTNTLNGHEFVETIYRVYNEIAQWRKNLFQLPSRKAAKMFIWELTSWLEHRTEILKSIALKVYMILPLLLLLKPNPNSKARDETKKTRRTTVNLERR